MRKLLILILAVSLLLAISPFIHFSAPAAPAPQILAPIMAGGHQDAALVGWWPLNGDSNDYSGNEDNGTWNGTQAGTNGYYSPGTGQTWVGVFNGTNNYVQLPSNFGITKTTPFTLSAWVYPTALPANKCAILMNGDQNSPWAGIWFRMSDDTAAGYPNFKLNDTSTPNYIKTVLNAALSINGWYNIVTTYDGSVTANGLTIYVNGSAPAQTRSNSGTFGTLGTDNFRIGVPAGSGPNQWFTGYIRDCRIYSRALSAAEVAHLYAGGNP